MPGLNKTIHQPVRLKIMAALATLDSGESMDFVSLRKMLSLTDGNLGAHLQTLQEAGYIEIEKTFVAKKPRSYVKISHAGIAAFDAHVAVLRAIIGNDAI